jgi:hypothetical protein
MFFLSSSIAILPSFNTSTALPSSFSTSFISFFKTPFRSFHFFIPFPCSFHILRITSSLPFSSF